MSRDKMLIEYDLGFVTSEFFKKFYYSKKQRCLKKIKDNWLSTNRLLSQKVWDRDKILKELDIPLNKKIFFMLLHMIMKK